MVVAEVPLWVVHNNNSSEPLQQSLQVLQGGGGVLPGGAAAAASSSPSPLSSVRATAAVALLKQGKSMKSPIYSVDCHPRAPIFATGGGDGTVKIWNSRALFPQRLQHDKRGKNDKIDGEGRYDPDTGAYVSSSGSSSGGGGGSDADESKEGEDDDEDDDDDQEDSSSSSASSSSDNELLHQPATAALPDIHDLSDRVRHKTNGGTVHSPSRPAAAAAAARLSSPSSRATATTNGSGNPFSSPSASTPTSNRKKHHHHHARLLATLTAHTGSCVLCVRFSNQGKLLASAGDDAVVCIYQRMPDSHQWVRSRLCRGHGLDVVDLAWAPDDSHIVSASLDSATPIIVWKLNTSSSGTNYTNNTSNSMILSPYKILGTQIHTSCVKGITFDPAGSYLASSGDDPAICVWRAHDDWGLEQRIESIFDPSQKQESMFRRLSWSTDGSFICSTNSVVQKKHVASTVSREGWNVSSSSPQQQAHGCANLVGHRQPVVVSRHAPILLNSNNKQDVDARDNNQADSGNGNDPSKYAALFALGDKKGFVTIWTTKKSRPLFKLQCSESRCCVTDLAWGKLSSHHSSSNNNNNNNNKNGGASSNPDLMLLVTLLDGQVVALHFTSDEIGPVLTQKEQGRVFASLYGIDADGDGPMSGFLVGETGGPKFVESTLQMSLEEQQEEDDNGDNLPGMEVDDEDHNMTGDASDDELAQQESIPPPRQTTTTTTTVDSKGRKRVRPVLVSVGAHYSPKKAKRSNATRRGSGASSKQQPVDPLQRAIQAAEKASNTTQQQQQDGGGGTVTTATSVVGESETASPAGQSSPLVRQTYAGTRATSAALSPGAASANIAVPYSTDRVHVAELPVMEEEQQQALMSADQQSKTSRGYMAECTNSLRVPRGSNGGSVPIIDVRLTQDGRVLWRDQIPGTSCCCVAASRSFLAVGTADGIIQLYGGSPSMGWKSGCGFRSHPPLVLGHPVVTLRLEEQQQMVGNAATEKIVEMLVVTADGTFTMYSLLPNLNLQYKGSVMPAITHMALSASSSSSSISTSSTERNLVLPKLSRIQLTESGRLLMLLSYESPVIAACTNQYSATAGGSRGGSTSSTTVPESVGGALQAFVYDRASELWMRMSDSRFVLSDFYSSLPSSSKGKTTKGTTLMLGELDDTVRIGSLQSPLKANSIYNQNEDDSRNFDATRSHCEDRMACALAIGSASEFKHWLGLYVRILSLAGQSPMLRVLVDMLQTGSGDRPPSTEGDTGLGDAASTSWWLSSAPEILGLERRGLVKSIVFELSKNRSLQRLTNELSLELEMTSISKAI